MNGSERIEAKQHFVVKGALFSVFIPTNTHFEHILNEIV